MQLFLDLDGVLADFDQHHEDIFGVRPCKTSDSVDWNAIRDHRDFYLNIPPMKDLPQLWRRVERYRPIILTGVPHSIPEAVSNKLEWVKRNVGENVEVRCCLSKEKSLHASPGDILIDDWEKYRHLWEGVGGVWITHTDAESTSLALDKLGL